MLMFLKCNNLFSIMSHFQIIQHFLTWYANGHLSKSVICSMWQYEILMVMVRAQLVELKSPLQHDRQIMTFVRR